MSPRSLLFSSDQETSRQISQVLQELELNVESCTEIFAALKTLTSKTVTLLIIDWDEGLEAGFLLKTARESRSNGDIFAIVVGRSEAQAAFEHAGADLVLSKPLQPEKTRHALLTCKAFTSRLATWTPRTRTAASWPGVAAPQAAMPQVHPQAKAVPGWPAPATPVPSSKITATAAKAGPLHLSFATFESGLSGESVFRKVFRPGRSIGILSKFANSGWQVMALRSVAIGVAFFAVGYALSQPLSEVTSMVASAGRKTWQSVRGADQQVETAQAAIAPEQEVAPDAPASLRSSAKMKVVSVRDAEPEQIEVEIPAAVAHAEASEESAPRQEMKQTSVRSPQRIIPASLGTPFPGVTAAREAAAKISPALMDALQPVMIPGELSEKLLLQKIDPSYPQRALRAGLRGPVVLQAWIGKDGKIQELKLIRGPLVLGEAAFDAVRNWRYKPYVQNGEAVEAQTMVTVDFKLP